MLSRISSAALFLRDFRRDENGAIAILAGAAMAVLLGIAGLSIDMGNLLAYRNQLQAATNAAAMAGANALILPGATGASAQTAATNWASTYPVPGLTITASTATAKCANPVSNMPNCTSANPNIVTVVQTATVPALLAKFVGFNGPFTFSAVASASKAGGTAIPLNIIVLLDATQSMNTADSGCTVPGKSNPTRAECALYGIQEVLTVMVPPQDQVSIMAFPGYASSTGLPCSGGSPVKYYTPGIVYTVVPFKTDYSSPPGTLNNGSNLVKAAGNRPSLAPCFKAVGGQGSFLAEAMTAAQAAFPQTTGTQNVLILLSDGQAQVDSSQMYCSGAGCPNSGAAWVAHGTKQCTQSVTAATAAKNSGGAAGKTWIYSVAYGSPTSACGTGDISPCTEMQQVASDVTRFFTTNATCKWSGTPTNPVSSLPAALLQIAYSLNKARLIPAT